MFFMEQTEHTIERSESSLGQIARTLFPLSGTHVLELTGQTPISEHPSASFNVILMDGHGPKNMDRLHAISALLKPAGVIILHIPNPRLGRSPADLHHDLHTAGLRATHLYLPFPSVSRLRFLIPLGSKQALRFALCSLHDQRHPLLSLLFRWVCGWTPCSSLLARFARDYLVVATHE